MSQKNDFINILEDRVISFAAEVSKILRDLPSSHTAFHLTDQMQRSCLSVPLNFAEARGSESRRDFVHKLGICLKELRETQVGLKLIRTCNLMPEKNVEELIREADEIISIFVTSITTAKRNLKK